MNVIDGSTAVINPEKQERSKDTVTEKYKASQKRYKPRERLPGNKESPFARMRNKFWLRRGGRSSQSSPS